MQQFNITKITLTKVMQLVNLPVLIKLDCISVALPNQIVDACRRYIVRESVNWRTSLKDVRGLPIIRLMTPDFNVEQLDMFGQTMVLLSKYSDEVGIPFVVMASEVHDREVTAIELANELAAVQLASYINTLIVKGRMEVTVTHMSFSKRAHMPALLFECNDLPISNCNNAALLSQFLSSGVDMSLFGPMWVPEVFKSKSYPTALAELKAYMACLGVFKLGF